jgi:hypothetical protein
VGRTLSTIVAVALLLGLSALAVLALPGSGAPMTAGAVAAAPLAAEPDAPAAMDRINVISMPLDATAQFATLGETFDAKGLATVTGAGVKRVATWNAAALPVGAYRTYIPGDPDSDNFPLEVGHVYRLLLDSNSGTVVSFVGDVPDPGSVVFTLVRPAGSGCIINDVSLPLDRSDLANASALAVSVGNVSRVSEWNAEASPAGAYRTYIPGDPDSENFTLRIGYPYRLCLTTGGETKWP